MVNKMNTPIRNFNLYNSRHEAYIAYKALKQIPYWFEDDGIPAFIAVDFHEWIWLPIREDGRYNKALFKKSVDEHQK